MNKTGKFDAGIATIVIVLGLMFTILGFSSDISLSARGQLFFLGTSFLVIPLLAWILHSMIKGSK